MEPTFGILGHTTLRVDGRVERQWAQTKVRAMAAVLLLRPGQAVRASALSGWLWDTDGERRSESNPLHTYASRLRRQLARAGVPPDSLVSRDGAYRLMVDPQSVDYHVFLRTVGRAKDLAAEGDHRGACRLFDAALELWRDEPLADLRTQRADSTRRSMRDNELLPACYALLDSRFVLGDFGAMLGLLDNLENEHPLDLVLTQHKLRALYGLGRADPAVAFFLSVHQRLRGVDGDDEAARRLREFHERLTAARTGPQDAPSATEAPVIPNPVVASQLPHGVMDFAGRGDVLAEMDALIDEHPGIVVVDGSPGVGKTALVVHWARRVLHRFPDGVLFAALDGFAVGARTEHTEVVAGFLEALGVSVDQVPDFERRQAKLRKLLSDRRMLVVLDNAENTAHVRPLLTALPNCLVLITSRRSLHRLAVWDGVRRITLPPLSDAESTAWLTRRIGARAVEDAAACRQLVEVCAGVPLALHIVGEHAADRPKIVLADLVNQLHRHHALLDLGQSGHDESATLRATFSWSYRALDPEVRALFRLLGLHPGSDVSVGAAAALVGQPAQRTREWLEVLVGAHLLDNNAVDRYRFHDLLRDYAAGCATTDESPALRRAATHRLVSWYLHTASHVQRQVFPHRAGVPTLPLPDGVEPLVFTTDEQALTWCAMERPSIVATVLLAEREQFPDHAWRLANMVGALFRRCGNYDDAVTIYNAALRSLRSIGDPESEAGTLNNLGTVHLTLHDHEAALTCFQSALDLFTRVDDKPGIAASLHNIATQRIYVGAFADGMLTYERALVVERESGSIALQANTLQRIGEANRANHRFGEAMSRLNEALWLGQQAGDVQVQGAILSELAGLYHQRGDLLAALDYCQQAMTIHDRTRDVVRSWQTKSVLAAVLLDRGEHSRAAELAAEAVNLAERGRDYKAMAAAVDLRGRAHYAGGRHEAAREDWERALEVFRDLRDPRADTVAAQLAELPGDGHGVPAARSGSITPPVWLDQLG